MGGGLRYVWLCWAGLSAALLAGCAVGPPVTSLPLGGGDVTLAAPPGHCIDRQSLQRRKEGSFVALGSCAALTGNAEATPAQPVVLTGLVSDPLPGPAPTPAQIEAFLRSPQGRASLASDGDPASVRILQSQTRSGVLYLKHRDRSGQNGTALTDEIWRAAYPEAGRIVVLSARSLASRPVSSDTQLSLLRRFVAASQAATKAGAAP